MEQLKNEDLTLNLLMQAISTQWVKAFSVIPPRAEMTAGIKSAKNRSI
jgi:hypothetical protein